MPNICNNHLDLEFHVTCPHCKHSDKYGIGTDLMISKELFQCIECHTRFVISYQVNVTASVYTISDVVDQNITESAFILNPLADPFLDEDKE